jgi:hypothetical protein
MGSHHRPGNVLVRAARADILTLIPTGRDLAFRTCAAWP